MIGAYDTKNYNKEYRKMVIISLPENTRYVLFATSLAIFKYAVDDIMETVAEHRSEKIYMCWHEQWERFIFFSKYTPFYL